MDDTAELLKALARVKVEFQARTIETIIYGEPARQALVDQAQELGMGYGDGGSEIITPLRRTGPP